MVSGQRDSLSDRIHLWSGGRLDGVSLVAARNRDRDFHRLGDRNLGHVAELRAVCDGDPESIAADSAKFHGGPDHHGDGAGSRHGRAATGRGNLGEPKIVESANRTKDKFLAMLSHELRTPLTPVVLALETLQKQWPQNEGARSTLEMIRRNIAVESHLIDDLLDLTRISKGKLELELVKLDAHAQVCNVVEMCRAEAEAKKIRLQVNLRATDHHIAADEARFQQIIWNLLKNAFKFSRQAGKVMISSTNESPQQLTISVQDAGIGIAPDVMERMFDPFEQGERSLKERFGGLGLGLAICKSLTQAHGASLIAKSDGINRGATFSLAIRTVWPAQNAAGSKRQPQLSARTFRILLVDDHADTCAVLQKLLEARGHKVTATHDMHSALDTAERDHFDLIISDVGLPDGNGTELMKRLRVASRIRGIAISGFGSNADREKSLAAGFSEHLVKPITIERLEVAIQTVLTS